MSDLITTALVPGQKAPVLIPEPMVRRLRPGAVIVDLAAEQGGNCEVTKAGEDVMHHGILVLGPVNLPATLPYIMAGVRLAVGRAVVAMVIAEFFTSISGLGAIIINAANNFDTATMFVPIVVLMVLAIGLNTLIGAVEGWVAPWQAEIAGRDQQ